MIAGAWLCLFVPLGAAVAITLAGTRISRTAAAWISTLSTFVAFGGAVWSFLSLRANGSDSGRLSTAWTWLESGGLKVGVTILVDPLSTLMMLIVSGVGGLIVLYSIGYMQDDPEERRYFAYMSFFVFSMLMLVESGNLLLLLVGWGLVGLSSYLLIGFWHERPSAVAAAKKAFVMNAVGDATMALSFFVLIAYTNSLSFATNFNAHLSPTATNLVALGLLGGAVAKSAQIPLHTWLPDAMEGPTPVSALIHAATMVTAGVYLVVRTHAIFEAARTVELVAAGLGALTLLVAGLVALVQVDIKRVIAYSTMSQIGYMFLGAGIGAYAGGMFHLMTHAFFKALLFMAAGVAIHAMSGEQDIRRMRGIGTSLPWTKRAFLIGALALAGVPPFAGFFSKDSIIAAAFHAHWYGAILGIVALSGTFLTGVYTFRLYFIVFGKGDARAAHHGEGPWTMMLPVGILAVLSASAGFLQFAPLWTPLTKWLEPVAATLQVAEPTDWQEALASALAVGLALAGIAVAYAMYSRESIAVPSLPRLQRVLEHKFYFDEAYDAVFYRPAAGLARLLRDGFEAPWFIGTPSELGEDTLTVARTVRRIQTGLLRTYVLFLGTGMAVVAVVLLVVK